MKLRINDSVPIILTRGVTEGVRIQRTSLLQFIDLVYERNPKDKGQLREAVEAALEGLSEKAVPTIEKLKAELARVEAQISTLEAAKGRLERIINRRVFLFKALGLTALSTQWGFFFLYNLYGGLARLGSDGANYVFCRTNGLHVRGLVLYADEYR